MIRMIYYKQINLSGLDAAQRIHEMISSIPELKERKRLLHVHTNVSFALLDIINERNIDKFFDMEDKIITQSSCSLEEIIELISTAGSPLDKSRLAMVYYITNELKEVYSKYNYSNLRVNWKF